MVPLSLGFSNPALEGEFDEQERKRLARQDAHTYFALTLIWLGGMVPLALTKSRFSSFWVMMGQGPLPGTLLVMLPYLLLSHRSTRQLYTRHRLLCVTGFRLAMLLSPTINETLSHLKPEAQFSASPSSFFGTVCLGSGIATSWELALGLRVELSWHILLHALLAGSVITRLAPAFCAVPYMQHPALQRFGAAGSRITSLARLLLPSLDWNPTALGTSKPSAHQGHQHCYALLLTLHLIFGFWLSTVAVYVVERRRRGQFLAAELARQEALLGRNPAQTAQQLGIPIRELAYWCTFDASTVWLWCLALLPPLAASAWLAVLTLTTRFGAPAPSGA